MTALLLAGVSAFWLGILTSISPCPMATNLAAVSFVGARVGRGRAALIAGSAYVLGRALAYSVVGALVVVGLLSIPGAAAFLNEHMNRILGPLLVLVGMVLLGLIRIDFSNTMGGSKLREKVAGAGAAGALLLGILFALSFCPVSAALFFGSLVPLSIEHGSPVALPLVYGVATGLPVLALAVLIAVGSGAVGSALNRLQSFERWARRITGVLFILVGVYYVFRFILLS